jgi:glycerol-3-phosphate O-acyltransferase/dihydroxyacetone phosphate acyltransferase
MFWHSLRFITSFFIAGFYKRIQARNLDLVKLNAPVIIAMNHPNAFTDPVVITVMAMKKLNYLARGDAFKPGIVTWFLSSIGIIPIFRISEGGKEGLKKNEETYRFVNDVLRKNGKVMVFAEGLCIQERRLRPLKKGVARMVFGAWDEINNENLLVLPVGVNYSEPNKLRSSIYYNIGEPIAVKPYIEAYRQNPAKTYNRFLQDLEPRMKDLVTHISNPADDKTVLQVETLAKEALKKERGWDLEDLEKDFLALKELTEKVNRASAEKNPALATFRQNADEYFKEIEKENLKDWILDPARNSKRSRVQTLLRLLPIVLGFPLMLVGVIANYPPYRLAQILTKKTSKHIEFYSSFMIGYSAVLFLLFFAIWFFVLHLFMPGFWAFFSIYLVAASAWLVLYYLPFVYKTCGLLRYFRKPEKVENLRRQRAALVELINKF